MGVIKDGKVSGFLPSTGAFAVHYPGYPSSFSRAVETLGGTEGIQKVSHNPIDYLGFSFFYLTLFDFWGLVTFVSYTASLRDIMATHLIIRF